MVIFQGGGDPGRFPRNSGWEVYFMKAKVKVELCSPGHATVEIRRAQ